MTINFMQTFFIAVTIFAYSAVGALNADDSQTKAETSDTFTCEGLEMVAGGTEENLEWVLDEDIVKIEFSSTLTPLWDIKVYGPQGAELHSGTVPSVKNHVINEQRDSSLLEIASLILKTKSDKFYSYQEYPVWEDRGDSTGFSIYEFFKMNENGEAVEPAGSIFVKGWGYGRCVNQIID